MLREVPDVRDWLDAQFDQMQAKGHDPDREEKVLDKPDPYWESDAYKVFDNAHKAAVKYAQDTLEIPFSKRLNWLLATSIARDILHWSKCSFASLFRALRDYMKAWELPLSFQQKVCKIFHHRDCDTGFGVAFEEGIKSEDYALNMTLAIMKKVMPHVPKLISLFLKQIDADRLDRRRTFLNWILTLDNLVHLYALYSRPNYQDDEGQQAIQDIHYWHPQMVARVFHLETALKSCKYMIIGVRHILPAFEEKLLRDRLKVGMSDYIMQKAEAQNVKEYSEVTQHNNYTQDQCVRQNNRSDLHRLEYIKVKPNDHLNEEAVRNAREHEPMRSEEYVNEFNEQLESLSEEDLRIWRVLKLTDWTIGRTKKAVDKMCFGEVADIDIHGGNATEEVLEHAGANFNFEAPIMDEQLVPLRVESTAPAVNPRPRRARKGKQGKR